jgi:hypothetical protein
VAGRLKLRGLLRQYFPRFPDINQDIAPRYSGGVPVYTLNQNDGLHGNPPYYGKGRVLRFNVRRCSVVTGYGLDDRGIGVRVSVVSRIVASPYRPDGP